MNGVFVGLFVLTIFAIYDLTPRGAGWLALRRWRAEKEAERKPLAPVVPIDLNRNVNRKHKGGSR